MNLLFSRRRNVAGLNSSRRRISTLNGSGDSESLLRLAKHGFGKLNSEYPKICLPKFTLFRLHIGFVVVAAK